MSEPPRDTWVIEPRGISLAARIKEAWRSRSLIGFFAYRAAEQIMSRTLLGFAWLVLRPGVPIAVMVFVFGVLMKVQFESDAPYVIHFLYGMTAFSAFEGPLIWSTRGLFMNRALLVKMYFPRLLVPLGSTFPGIVEFLVHLGFLTVATLIVWATTGRFWVALQPDLLFSLAAIAIAFTLAVGIGLFTSLWDYQARDTRYTLSVVLRFLLYLTPVIYPASTIPEAFRVFYFINPLASVVETFRLGLLGHVEQAPLSALAYSAVVAAVLFIAGLLHFNAKEAAVIDRA